MRHRSHFITLLLILLIFDSFLDRPRSSSGLERENDAELAALCGRVKAAAVADEAGSAAGEVLGLGAGGAEAADVLARVKAAAPAGPSGLAAARIGRPADASATSGTWQPKGHQHVH